MPHKPNRVLLQEVGEFVATTTIHRGNAIRHGRQILECMDEAFEYYERKTVTLQREAVTVFKDALIRRGLSHLIETTTTPSAIRTNARGRQTG